MFEHDVRTLLRDKAVNEEKDKVEGAFKTSQAVWGVIMSTEDETASLPERRIQKGAVLLADSCFDYGSKDVTLKQLQQFRGILTGWASIVKGLSERAQGRGQVPRWHQRPSEGETPATRRRKPVLGRKRPLGALRGLPIIKWCGSPLPQVCGPCSLRWRD